MIRPVVPDAVLLFNPDGGIRGDNPAECRELGKELRRGIVRLHILGGKSYRHTVFSVSEAISLSAGLWSDVRSANSCFGVLLDELSAEEDPRGSESVICSDYWTRYLCSRIRLVSCGMRGGNPRPNC